MVKLVSANHTSEEVRGEVGHSIESRRLEILEAGVVEDLGDAALECCAVEPRR
jgi:hypothetical protein